MRRTLFVGSFSCKERQGLRIKQLTEPQQVQLNPHGPEWDEPVPLGLRTSLRNARRLGPQLGAGGPLRGWCPQLMIKAQVSGPRTRGRQPWTSPMANAPKFSGLILGGG